jgi:hypothetical protein
LFSEMQSILICDIPTLSELLILGQDDINPPLGGVH